MCRRDSKQTRRNARLLDSREGCRWQTARSGLLWSGFGLGAGALFRRQVNSLLAHMSHVGSFAAVIIGAVLAAYIGYKWWERRRFFSMLRMARISVEELNRLMQADASARPLIVDVRSSTARALQAHWIPGALHVPMQSIGEHVAELPRDRDIVLYCTCPSEASAARVAKVLMNHGFKKVRPLHGGLDAWIAAGFAVERPAAT